MATVIAPDHVYGMKGDAELDYRNGNVSISLSNIGLVIATVEETKQYLGIN